MKLWLIEARSEELPKEDNPWVPWYDKVFGMVVRSETEEAAREEAGHHSGDEGKRPWGDSKYSTCIELLPGTDESVQPAATCACRSPIQAATNHVRQMIELLTYLALSGVGLGVTISASIVLALVVESNG